MLEKKTYKNYDRISRYSNFPIYFNTTDQIYQGGLTGWLSKSTMYVARKIERGDTLDSLALYYYGNPTYFWIIADFNRIDDCFQELVVGDTIKIPTFSDVMWES